MIEIMRTNNPVTLSYAEALMKDAGIVYFIADVNMSIMDGSIGVLPRRFLVDADCEAQARRLLRDAGLGKEMRD